VISLPINTMKTAGVNIPINGTNIEGNQLAASSEDIKEFKFCCYFIEDCYICVTFITR